MEDKGDIPRVEYLSQLRTVKDTDMIKILTGIRRCGKSTIMRMFMSEIISSGTPEDRIAYVDLDEEGFVEPPADAKELLDMVKSQITPGEDTYVFIDEVQDVPGWERAVEALRNAGSDVYITGSNSGMLSSELSSKLSGRYVEIQVYPLSFSEYTGFRDGDVDALFNDYIRYGGMPGIARVMDRVGTAMSLKMLSGIYNTVMNKDVLERHSIRNVPTLMNLSKFVMRNIGDRTSSRNTSNYMTSAGVKTSHVTVEEYLGHLEAAYIVMRCHRLDSKTKDYLVTSDKFYPTDLGIRHCVVPFSIDDIDGILEDVVYLELMRRYGDVTILSVNGMEVDFVADPTGSPMYYQVTMTLSDPTTRERELRSLMALDDNHPKTVITYDRFPVDDIDGIKVVQITDWLLGRQRFTIDGKEKPERTLSEEQASCFGILDMTDKEMVDIIRENPYVFSKLKKI